MNRREFFAALAGLDRSNWPVQPVQAERSIRRALRLLNQDAPLVEWTDAPPSAIYRNNGWGVLQGISHHDQHLPSNWLSVDNQITGLLVLGWPQGPPNLAASELLMDAYVAGAFAVYQTQERTLVIGQPVIRLDEQRRLHDTRRPAVAWPGGPYHYHISGVWVEERFVTGLKQLRADDFQGITNQEVRRVLIEQYGWRKYLRQIRAVAVNRDAVHGTLWSATPPRGDLDFQTGRTMRLLEVKDPSTARKYFIRVPPDRVTAMSARAWAMRKTVADLEHLRKEA